jgi:hypothetical protein
MAAASVSAIECRCPDKAPVEPMALIEALFFGGAG